MPHVMPQIPCIFSPKPCRARCCSCSKKIERMNQLLEEIPRMIADPAYMCDHCIRSEGTCPRCQFIARMKTLDKLQGNDQVQRFLSEWSTELKKLQSAIISCQDVCIAGDASRKPQRDVDVESIAFTDFPDYPCSDSDEGIEPPHVELRITPKKISFKAPTKVVPKSDTTKGDARSPNKKSTLSKVESEKETEKKPKKRVKKKENIVYSGKCAEDTAGFTLYQLTSLTKCPPEKLLSPITRDSMVSLRRLKELAALDDMPQSYKPKEMIRECSVVKYKDKSVIDYDIPKNFKFGTVSSTDSTKSSWLLEEEEKEPEPIPIRIFTARGPGKFRYKLSDRKYIAKGWTCLPTLKTMRLVRIFKTTRTQSIYDWFDRHKNKVVFYDSGETFGHVNMNGEGYWYYKNGATAFYKGPKDFVVYGEYCNAEKQKIIAWFDQLGNCVVYDNDGKIRLQYNQIEGSILEKCLQPPSTWIWHRSDDPLRYKDVYAEKLLNKPTLEDKLKENIDVEYQEDDLDEMLIIEGQNLSKFRDRVTYGQLNSMRMIAFKLTDKFSLRIVNQNCVFVSFSDGSINVRCNVGMTIEWNHVLDDKEVSLVKGKPMFLEQDKEIRTTRMTRIFGTLDKATNTTSKSRSTMRSTMRTVPDSKPSSLVPQKRKRSQSNAVTPPVPLRDIEVSTEKNINKDVVH